MSCGAMSVPPASATAAAALSWTPGYLAIASSILSVATSGVMSAIAA